MRVCVCVCVCVCHAASDEAWLPCLDTPSLTSQRQSARRAGWLEPGDNPTLAK